MTDSVTTDDIKTLLHWLTDTDAPYCLVGGLAVSLWADHLLDPDEKTAFHIPLHSKDVDFRGGASEPAIADGDGLVAASNGIAPPGRRCGDHPEHGL